jgi:hypothetical protein
MRDISKNLSQNPRDSALQYSIAFLHRKYQSFMQWHAGNGMGGVQSLTNLFRKGGENTFTVRCFNSEGLF